MSVPLLIIGLLLFVSLVVVHEFGHFIMARRNGVGVEEFSIFFGPALYQHTTKAGWVFSFRCLPLGGYVKLKGEHDTDTELGSYGAATLWIKTKIMAAGVVMNVITGLILLTILALIGMPRLVNNQFTIKKDTKITSSLALVNYVIPGSPAAKTGLKGDDALLTMNLPGYSPVDITNAGKLPSITKQFAGKTVQITYLRQGQHHSAQATLLSAKTVAASQKTDNPKGYLGIEATQFVVQRSTWSAPIVAVGFSAQITALTFQGLGHAIGGLGGIVAGAFTANKTARVNAQTTASNQVSGPIGIFEILKVGSLLGYKFMLLIIAVISLTLAIMNILPIPALDGGRLWITLIAHGLKKPLSPKREERITIAGMAVLLTLFVLISVVDVKRFF